MSSTEFNIGLPDEKSSSRILKPPGGGHSNIFGAPEVKANPPRAKYNQQNSSNMNGVMGTTDPNIKVGSVQSDNGPAEVEAARQTVQSKGSHAVHEQSQQESQQAGGRSRVPPGGFSSGLW